MFWIAPSVAERHGVERPAVVAQLDRAQAEGFDRALVAAALDVLADAEGVVEQVEHAADDVLDQRLRAEADGDADHAGAGDQRSDLDAERRERHQRRHGDQGDEEDVAQDRQQRAQPRPAPRLLGVRLARGLRLRELAVDHGLQHMPGEVGEQHDHDRAEGAAHETGDQVSLAVSATRSTCQAWASRRAAPMISAARRPRSRQTARTLGGPAPASTPGGRRI